MADPHPTYARLRNDAPVHRLVQPDGLPIWFVARYDEARTALADPRLAHHLRHARPAMADAGLEISEDRIEFNAAHLVHSDPPDHTRLRSLVNRAFTPARVERLRPRIHEVTHRLLDAVQGDDEVDLVETLNNPLPVTVVGDLLGVPAGERRVLRRWAEAAVTPEYTKDAPLTKAEGNALLREYIAGLVHRSKARTRRGGSADEQPNLLRALVAACADEGRLAESEVVAMTYILLLAGHESTVNFLGNAELALLTDTSLIQRLREDPSLIRSAVDELLRYDGPVQRSTLRTAVQQVEIGGVVIPKGGIVSIGLASANRDPGCFEHPDMVQLDRRNNLHLALGHGPHYCIGAYLARMEAEIALGELVRRYPRMRLAIEPTDLQWRQAFQRGLVRLPVRLGRHA